MERRLAAILSADVVGYSRLIRADEEGTLAALKSVRTEFVESALAANRGRIFKLTGDGVLAEFASAVDAVRAAAAIQESMTRRNREVPHDQRIEFRIGINLGDVIIDGDDMQGDGVNLAVRIEGLARPGGICIAGAVYDEVRDRIELPFGYLGEQRVKNIDRPIRMWHWPAVGDADPEDQDHPGKPLPVPEKPSIVVLPFDNLNADSAQEYFSDGVTEDIINGLALWRSFPVIARNSSFAYKGRSADVRTVAAELGARYVLEGSIRRAQDRVRVTVQLIDAKSGHHLWADRLDREMGEIFDLQDEIVERIVAATAPEVLRAEERRANQKRPTDLNAWDLILRAMSAKAVGYGYGTREGNSTAKELLDRAIALEPSAEAWARRALCAWHDAINGWVEDSEGALTECIDFARHAMQQDDSNWLAHSVLGIALLFGRGQATAAVEEAIQSVNLNPSSSMARHILGCSLDFAGDQEEAIRQLEAVFDLDPRYANRAAAYADLCLSNLLIDKFEEAVAWAEKTVAADPDYVRGRQRLVAALAAAGRLDEARAQLAELLSQQPDFSLGYVERTYPFGRPDQAARFAGWLAEAGVD